MEQRHTILRTTDDRLGRVNARNVSRHSDRLVRGYRTQRRRAAGKVDQVQEVVVDVEEAKRLRLGVVVWAFA